MKTAWKLAVVILLAVMVNGCGGASPAPGGGQADATTGSTPSAATSAATSAAPTAPVVLPVDANSAPNEVVMAFLNGMRDGNSGITAALLTAKAQEETVKHNWPVQPPGAPSATYQLGQPAFLDAQQSAVQVPCVWSEPDGAGGMIQFEVDWTLRRQPDGWRIAGFASQVVPGRAPYFFNFEDIVNLKAAQDDAEAALAEMMKGEGSPSSVAEKNPSDNTLR